MQWEILPVELMLMPNYALKAHLSLTHKIRDSSRGALTWGIFHPLEFILNVEIMPGHALSNQQNLKSLSENFGLGLIDYGIYG